MPVLYARIPAKAALQAAGDLAFMAWIVAAWASARSVRATVMELAAAGRDVESRTNEVAGRVSEAGDSATRVPLVGDALAVPLRQAAESLSGLAQVSRDQVSTLESLALWTGMALFLFPVALAVVVWIPRRVRFVRTATAAQHLVDNRADVDLFALRAMANQPMHRLARISADPVGDWRRGDSTVIRALARLELEDAGLALPVERRGT